MQASREKNLHKTKVREKERRATRKGIDPTLVEQYRIEHHNQCDICGKAPSKKKDLGIDHDHETLKFRGMLCDNCNNGLGRFQDNTTILEAAIKYLTSPPADLLMLKIGD